MDSSSSLNPQRLVKKIFQSPSLKRKKHHVPLTERLKLEKVLGLTVSCNAALDCDPNSGNVAFPAGCVVVIQNARKNKQSHFINSSKKTITSLAYSWDGKYIVTGECGHLPNVRVWDIQEKTQIAEFAGHKYGINCVSFSPNLKYVVSVGSQHDMIVNVWDWKNNVKVASNKVSSKVKAISFASSGNYFVTVGNRHVKFWYLEYSRSTKYKLEAVPLMGRSAILGEQRNNYFCSVACGRGKMSDSTFAITKSGLLCEFNSRRLLDKWVELRTSSANCMSVGDDYIFVGCSDGVVRCFSPLNLHFVTTLPKTHHLGVDVSKGLTISHMGTHPNGAKYPDTVALTYDETNKKVTCVYNDHSMYTWDIKDVKKIGKSNSCLYHSACIWGIEMYPRLGDGAKSVLPSGSFITCSSDDTVRVWNLDQHMASDTVYKRNIYSNELLKILYMDDDLSYLCDVDFNPAGSNDKTDTTYDGKNGVRCIRIGPDGKNLASGDRSGNVRIHDLQFMDELCKIEAHDSEVLCLEYSRPDTGHEYLASASRDRLIHVFDVDRDYAFLQTLDDHSSSITAVRFLQCQGNLMMLSCGADKSIIFRTAQFVPQLNFVRDRHVVGKTTLYDMDVDVSQKHILTACQDRNIRVFNVANGKQSKCFKGSHGEDGTLIKVVLDNSGMFIATSSTDKNLSIHDYYTGECVAATCGHSELVTGLKFSNDCKHLISASGDGCIFVWKLPSQFTQTMQTRLAQIEKHATAKSKYEFKRQTITMDKPMKIASELSIDKKQFVAATPDLFDENSNDVVQDLNIPGYRFSVGQLPSWAKKQITTDEGSPPNSGGTRNDNFSVQPKGRWAQRVDAQEMMFKSVSNLSSFDEEVELRQKTPKHVSDIRRETMILSKKNPESSNFNNLKSIRSEMNLRELDMSKITTERGESFASAARFKSMANLEIGKHELTESSSGSSLTKMEASYDTYGGDFDSNDSEETDATEPESTEIVYYPPPTGLFDGDSSFKVQATTEQELREARRKPYSLFNRPSDLRINSVQPAGEDGSDEDEATTPVDCERTIMLSMSTENLDRIDKRETFMKNNYESLDGGGGQTFDNNRKNSFAKDSADDENDANFNPRHSISAKFLSKSLRSAPSARNSNLANMVQKNSEKDNKELPSSKKQELTKALNDTKKKLEALGWKIGTKSVTNLNLLPEKDSTTDELDDPKVRSRYGEAKNDDRYDVAPNRMNWPNQRNSSSAALYSRQNGDSSAVPVSRSISMSSLSDVGVVPRMNSKVHKVPSVQTLNKMNAYKKGDAEKRSNLSKSSSSASLYSNTSKKPDRRKSTSTAFELRKAVFETPLPSDDRSPAHKSRTSGKHGSNGERTRADSVNRLSKSESRSSLSSTPRSNLSSRSSSERDLSKIARDVTERLSPSATVAKPKHESYAKKSTGSSTTTRKSVAVPSAAQDTRKELEKSPQEFPVKDRVYTGYRAITEDVYTAPLSRELCDSLASDLRQVTSEAMVLFQRVTLDNDLPQADKSELMNILAQGVWQAQQNLRPAVLPLPMYSSKSSDSLSQFNLNSAKSLSSPTHPLEFMQTLDKTSSLSNSTSGADVNAILKQYSDMLLNVIQERMDTGQPHQKS
ncbi:WDR62 (predicted) [Pycnogonum litorale]